MSISTTDSSAGSTPSGSELAFIANDLSIGFTRLSLANAGDVVRRSYGVDGLLTRLATEKDDTFRIDAMDGTRYVLKVSNPGESLDELDLQVAVMRHVAQVAPELPVPRVLDSIDGRHLVPIATELDGWRTARLYTWLDGTSLDSVHTTARQRYEIGEMLARLRLATASFTHPYEHRVIAWDVKHLTRLSGLRSNIADPLHRSLIDEALSRFTRIQPDLRRCPTQVVHNDFNRSNIVSSPSGRSFVAGIIDFGDTVHTAVAIDVATAVMNQFPLDFDADGDVDLFEQSLDLVQGYLAHAPLSELELRLIPHLAMARVAARALLTSWRAHLFPENEAYILRFTRPGWSHLRWLIEREHDSISHSLLNATSLRRKPL